MVWQCVVVGTILVVVVAVGLVVVVVVVEMRIILESLGCVLSLHGLHLDR